MDPKTLFASKTFWFNLLAALVLIANAFGYVEFTADPRVAEYAGVVVTLANIILRLATKTAIKL
jgi:uncharacterized membrane protein